MAVNEINAKTADSAARKCFMKVLPAAAVLPCRLGTCISCPVALAERFAHRSWDAGDLAAMTGRRIALASIRAKIALENSRRRPPRQQGADDVSQHQNPVQFRAARDRGRNPRLGRAVRA